MMTGRSKIVRPFPMRNVAFKNLVATSADCLAKGFLRETLRINIRGIEESDTGLKANITKRVASFTSLAPQARKKLTSATKRSSTKTQCRHLEARMTKLSKFHT